VAATVVSGVDVIRSAALGPVPHGFLGRRGGVSIGDLAGLNIGYGSSDARDAIAENRRRAVAAVLPNAALATVHQVHSATVEVAEQPWPELERPHADAMVTNRPNLLLGVLTADCAPVLFADKVAGVVGAAHAGWKGALAGVTDSTLAAMEQLGAHRERIRAAVGPCIAQASYEVDAAFQARFLEHDPENALFFVQADGGKPRFDLQGYVGARLRAAGIASAEAMRLDTYASADRFFSYRRATHQGESDYGRQVSLIGLAPSSA
jgi:YfiH family protein